MLYAASKNWGIKVERVELKDVKLPTSLQRAMAAEAEASRDARAKVGVWALKDCYMLHTHKHMLYCLFGRACQV